MILKSDSLVSYFVIVRCRKPLTKIIFQLTWRRLSRTWTTLYPRTWTATHRCGWRPDAARCMMTFTSTTRRFMLADPTRPSIGTINYKWVEHLRRPRYCHIIPIKVSNFDPTPSPYSPFIQVKVAHVFYLAPDYLCFHYNRYRRSSVTDRLRDFRKVCLYIEKDIKKAIS